MNVCLNSILFNRATGRRIKTKSGEFSCLSPRWLTGSVDEFTPDARLRRRRRLLLSLSFWLTRSNQQTETPLLPSSGNRRYFLKVLEITCFGLCAVASIDFHLHDFLVFVFSLHFVLLYWSGGGILRLIPAGVSVAPTKKTLR